MLPTPQPGRFVFADHVYSAEDTSVGIHTFTGQRVHTLDCDGDLVIHVMFRHVPSPKPEAPGRSYAWAVCRGGVRVWDVSDPEAPHQGPTMMPVAGWQQMGGAIDPATGAPWLVETRQVGQTHVYERRFWTWSAAPMAATRIAMGRLGESQSDRGGLVESLGTIGGRPLAAATYGERTAVVAVAPYPAVVSRTLPVLHALDSRQGQLHGMDGDAILGARARARGERPSWLQRLRRRVGLDAARWNVWTGLDGATPRKLSSLTCPGYAYDDMQNLAAFSRAGARYLLAGWTDGGEGEYVSLLSVSASGTLSHVRSPMALPDGIVPALIDVPAPGTVAYVWGFMPYTPPTGWRYRLVPIRLPDDLRLAYVGVPVELAR